MKKKKTTEQFDLFDQTEPMKNELEITPAGEKVIEQLAKPSEPVEPFRRPTTEEVNALVAQTGKSFRKCWFMAAERLNKKR